MAERIAREIADRLALRCLFYSDEAAETAVPEITAILRKYAVERERDELRELLIGAVPGIDYLVNIAPIAPDAKASWREWSEKVKATKARELSQPPAPARPEE